VEKVPSFIRNVIEDKQSIQLLTREK
jgi:hypothetical protein